VEDFQNLAILGQDLDGSLVPIASITFCHPGHSAATRAAASDWPLPFGIWLGDAAATSRVDYLNKLGGLSFQEPPASQARASPTERFHGSCDRCRNGIPKQP
jgi:hypothetical protein